MNINLDRQRRRLGQQRSSIECQPHRLIQSCKEPRPLLSEDGGQPLELLSISDGQRHLTIAEMEELIVRDTHSDYILVKFYLGRMKQKMILMTAGYESWMQGMCAEPRPTRLRQLSSIVLTEKNHFLNDLLYLFGFSFFAYDKLTTHLLVWLNPNKWNRGSAVLWYFSLQSKWEFSGWTITLKNNGVLFKLIINSVVRMLYKNKSCRESHEVFKKLSSASFLFIFCSFRSIYGIRTVVYIRIRTLNLGVMGDHLTTITVLCLGHFLFSVFWALFNVHVICAWR